MRGIGVRLPILGARGRRTGLTCVDARAVEHVGHQFKAHQRVVQAHQTLLERGGKRQQLAPAVGDPPAVVELSGIDGRHVGALRPAVQAVVDVLEGLCGVSQIFRYGNDRVRVQQRDVGDPQAMLELLLPVDSKTLFSSASQGNQTGLQLLQCGNPGQGADRSQVLWRGAGSSYLLTVRQGDHSKWRAGPVALSHHVKVADLEHAQWQDSTGKQDGVEWEKCKGMQNERRHRWNRVRRARYHRTPMRFGADVIGAPKSGMNMLLYEVLNFLVEVAVTLVGAACLVRVAMRWWRIPLGNPVGRLVQALCDWLVLPLQRVVPPAGRLDLAGLLGAWLLKLAQYALLIALLGLPRWAALPVLALLGVAKLAVSVATAIIIIAAVLSWMQNRTLPSDVLDRLADPILAPVRRVLPHIGGIDLSPVLAVVILQAIAIVLGSLQASLLGNAVVIGAA